MCISDYGFVQRRDSGCCSSFFGDSVVWPDMSMSIPYVKQNTSGIAAFLESVHKPKTLMLQKEMLTEGDIRLLAEAFYRPVGEWVNMSGQPAIASPDMLTSCDDFSVERIKNVLSPHLTQWKEIVSVQLFQGKKINSRLVDTLVTSGSFALYAGIYKGVAVSTGMTFSGSGTGIYMVATAAGHQKRGFGSRVVRRVLADSFSMGLDEVCLQSTAAGFRLYQSLGFVERSRSILFYKIK